MFNLDPVTHTLTLLGHLPTTQGHSEPAIVRIEKTALSGDSASDLLSSLGEIRLIEHTDIVCIYGSQPIYRITLFYTPMVTV